MTKEATIPVACNLNVFDTAQAERYGTLVGQLRTAVESVSEEQDGFRFVLPAEPALCAAAMEFATLERLCCPFLTLGDQRRSHRFRWPYGKTRIAR